MALVAYLQAATAERRLGSDRWMPSSRWPDRLAAGRRDLALEV